MNGTSSFRIHSMYVKRVYTLSHMETVLPLRTASRTDVRIVRNAGEKKEMHD